MGTFSASLRAIGDVKSLAATVELSDGQLRIVAGTTEIGSWPLSEIRLEEIPTGYRMAAEGEQILLEIKDLDSFTSELNNGTKKRRSRARVKTKAIRPSSDDVEVPAAPVPLAGQTIPAPVSKKTPASAARKKPKSSQIGGALLGAVDALLIRAKKRFGAVLPDFMFSRAMFAIVVAALIGMVLLPGVLSTVLLIAGVLTVLFGAIVYSDSVLASRWLPGRATPQQALLLGLGVLLLGVLLGVIAK